MPDQNDGNDLQREDRTKRRERANRILDVAAELLLRWGYKKTTIDDIARQAGVAKGTIYLHWKTRNDLFMALMLREGLAATLEILDRIASDPEGALLHRMVWHAMYVMMSRPLTKALFLRDAELLGELAHQSSTYNGGVLYREKLQTVTHMMELLRSKGLMRTDMRIDEQVHAFTAITLGFITVDQYMPDEYQLSVEQTVNQLAEVVRRSLEPPQLPSPEALQEVRDYMLRLHGTYAQVIHDQLQKLTE